MSQWDQITPLTGKSREERRRMVGMGRRFGASPEARARMAEADDSAVWKAVCRRCGEALQGSRKQLSAHICAGGKP